MKNYEIKRQPMKSGMAEVEIRKFKKVETHTKIWYIPIQDNPADELHVFIKKENPNSCFKGYGGATLKFLLEDGIVDEVKGPWHSNADSLFSDTGIDLRDKYKTIGAIGKGRAYEDGKSYITDVLHEDTDWVVGSFDRLEEMAQKFADELGIEISYYSQSSGGSRTSWAMPKK